MGVGLKTGFISMSGVHSASNQKEVDTKEIDHFVLDIPHGTDNKLIRSEVTRT